MKQVVQCYDDGALRLEDVPAPACRPGGVVVRAGYSLVSTGTERMKVTQARMSMVQKAKSRPDKVQQVIASVQQVGLIETYKKVKERLSALTPLGYSLAGTVVEVGVGLDEFHVGDRVACAGEGIACHAEYVYVPRNLCVHVPAGVELADAAFATVGAIALNGVRQAEVAIGDTVLVVGLGLVGLLAVQILKASGCRVLGVDLDPAKVAMSKTCGADEAWKRDDPGLEKGLTGFTDGLGPDAAYIAASTKSSDPMELAGRVLRDRGRVVIVGMVPIEADWQIYYRKELSVVMSRSYGPGRYDRNFEQKGIDYPVGYVRWTQRRNLSEFLRLVETGRVNPRLLEPKVFPFAEAEAAYQELHDAPNQHAAGMLFSYPPDATAERRLAFKREPIKRVARPSGGTVRIGLIGAGNFATVTLIPALKRCAEAKLVGICSAGGLSAASAGMRHGFDYAASDYNEIFKDDTIDAVVIATRHDTHAAFAAEALRAGKDVFVEKPLALNREQLDEVVKARHESGCIVTPGFNRRFSPLSVAVRDFLQPRTGPVEVVCRVNAGPLAADSWYRDSDVGGWRILSEGCHFIDLIQFFCGCAAESVFADIVGGSVAGNQNDNCVVMLRMKDGSLGTLVYVANGASGFDKERIEVFGQGRAAVIDSWQSALLVDGAKKRKIRGSGGAKGHAEELADFVRTVRAGSDGGLPFDDAVAATMATFAIKSSIASGKSEPVC